VDIGLTGWEDKWGYGVMKKLLQHSINPLLRLNCPSPIACNFNEMNEIDAVSGVETYGLV
jgi:hypothetical protein